jgi:hypothetical protein
MSDAESAQDFVRLVAGLKFDHSFNPYSDTCPEIDRPEAALSRRHNLQAVVEAALKNKVRSIWIARDLGYRGGRRTGLALTDEVHLAHHARLLGTGPLSKSTHGHPIAERTATVIWQMLLKIKEPIFLWNIFPLHPHNPGDPMSNRCHTKSERISSRHVLDRLMELLKPDFVLAIGRDSQAALGELGIDARTVRHPSYGGQTEFIQGVSLQYGIDATPDQHRFEI